MAVAQAISRGTFNRAPIDALEARRQGLQLLSLIPAAIYAFAYYLAWSRVSTGEIPESPTPQSPQTSQGLTTLRLSNLGLERMTQGARPKRLRISKQGLMRARFQTKPPFPEPPRLTQNRYAMVKRIFQCHENAETRKPMKLAQNRPRNQSRVKKPSTG